VTSDLPAASDAVSIAPVSQDIIEPQPFGLQGVRTPLCRDWGKREISGV